MKFSLASIPFIAVGVGSLLLNDAAAETLVLAPAADAALFEQSPKNNQGRNDTVPAGSTAKGQRSRALFQFDLSSIPEEAKMVSARLTLAITKAPLGGGSASTFGLHRVTTPWTEGIKTGNTGQKAGLGVTWEAATTPSLSWEQVGGDFATAASASIEMDSRGSYTFKTTEALVADIQEWHRSPDTNAGWALISNDETSKGTARRFASREHPEFPPQLEIEYILNQSAPPLSLAMNGLTNKGEARMIIKGEKSTRYLIEASEDLINWTELAEVQMADDTESVEYLDPQVLNTPHRFYRGKEKDTQTMAHIQSVQATGEPNSYSFTVSIQSPDLGCDQYADWWEVLSESGELLYRRILAHSHVNEQPFARRGGPIPIASNEPVFIRAHMNTVGYGGMAFWGSVETGFLSISLSANFASQLTDSLPLPTGCAF